MDKRMNAEGRETVERFRGGDREAFGELVRKHRAQAVDWAYAIVRDPFRAEDVAQDALIASFLRSESLERPDRFASWLRRIVRNKAYDALRAEKRRPMVPYSEETEAEDARTRTPERIAMDREWRDSVSATLQALPDRNRRIVEAHFFQERTPEEIAQAFGLAVSNVYNILSRSKMKLQEERFKRETALDKKRRLATGLASRRMLPIPEFRSAYASLGHVLHDALAGCANGSASLSDTMGYTGQAFRIQTTADCGLSGSLIYDWGYVLERIAETYGTRARWIGRPGQVPTPEALVQALDSIREAIGRGIPVVAWNLSRAEFSILYGFDDESERFACRAAGGAAPEVPYTRLGRDLDHPELFVGWLENAEAPSFGPPSLVRALDAILRHAHGQEPRVPGYVAGLAAYDSWIEAFEADRVQPVGHAYQVALLAEARQHAVAFLSDLAEHHPAVAGDSVVARLWREAADYYREVHLALTRLYPSFPYGMPGVRLDIREPSVRRIREARKAEKAGIDRLERIYSRWIGRG